MPSVPSICNFGFAFPSFSLSDFISIPAIPAIPSIPFPSFDLPTCLADLF